jgi:hypothetical protein
MMCLSVFGKENKGKIGECSFCYIECLTLELVHNTRGGGAMLVLRQDDKLKS